jgi:hypothetical protein
VVGWLVECIYPNPKKENLEKNTQKKSKNKIKEK